MIGYLVNFTLCSALLLLAYQLLLKNKAMYQFNRCYLLLSILFSLAVPLIVVQHNIAPLPSIVPEQVQILTGGIVTEENALHVLLPANNQLDYTLYICIAVYVLVTALLLFRFVKNLYSIRVAILQGEKVNYKGAQLILIGQDLTPHTFLNYIFIHKEDYYMEQVKNDLLQHELAHARQRHSVDIILLELVQAFCWFNPLLLFYGGAIRLNHEFIADAAALKSCQSLTSYQSLLLGMSAQLKSLNITSQFNYSITKKRLIMMTKTTTTATAWLTRLAIIPVMAIAFMLFCNKTNAQEPVADKKPAKVKATETAPVITKLRQSKVKTIFRDYPSTKEGITAAEMDEYTGYEKKYAVRRLDLSKAMTKPEEKRLEYLYQHMSREQQKTRMISFTYPPEPRPPRSISQAELDSWKDPAVYGVWIDDKRIKNADLRHHKPAEFNGYFFSRLTDKAVKHDKFHYQVDLMTLDFYKKFREEAIANRNNSMIMIHMKM